MNQCKTCKGMHNSDPHEWPPVWDVWADTSPSDPLREPDQDPAFGQTLEAAAEWATEHMFPSDEWDSILLWLRIKGSCDAPQRICVETSREESYHAYVVLALPSRTRIRNGGERPSLSRTGTGKKSAGGCKRVDLPGHFCTIVACKPSRQPTPRRSASSWIR